MIRNPIPGTTRKANNGGYAVDSGLDILVPKGTPCFAVADGVLVYSERGHTPWATPPDTPNSVLLKLDTPFSYKGHQVNYAWYTHLASLAHLVPDGYTPLRVKAGDPIGTTGVGNKVPHLHLGLIEDRAQASTMPQDLVAALIWDQTAPATPAKPAATTQAVELVSAEFVVRTADGQLLKLFHNANGTSLVSSP